MDKFDVVPNGLQFEVWRTRQNGSAAVFISAFGSDGTAQAFAAYRQALQDRDAATIHLLAAGNSAFKAQHTYFHRDVRFDVGFEQDQRREWVIYPQDGRAVGARHGYVALVHGTGSLRSAVTEAQRAIDLWLDVQDR